MGSRCPPHRSQRAGVEIEIRRARRVESCSNWPRFLKPLYDPGRSDFPSPVLASVLHAISQGGPSPSARNCGAGAPFAPTRWSLPRPFATMQAPRNPALCLVRTRLSWPPSAQSPFARSGRYPRRGGLKAAWRGVTPSSSLVRAHAPDHPLPAPPVSRVVRAVFAGCRQSLLGDGPSRHYLCDPCAGARTHTPPRSSAAHVRSFTEDTGLTPRETGSTRESIPTWQLRWGANFVAAVIRLPSGSCTRSAPRLLPPQQRCAPGRRAFHTTHRPAGYPDRDVASLHARHGQLAWLDSHQLDRGLVGRSLPHWAPALGDGGEALLGPGVQDARLSVAIGQRDATSTPRSARCAGCDAAAPEPVPHHLAAEGA